MTKNGAWTAGLCILLAVAFSSEAFPRDKKIKYGNTRQVEYVGEVVKKTPSGKGTLKIVSVPIAVVQDYRTTRQFADVLSGTFNCPESVEKGTVDGELLFSSGYLLQGIIEYELSPFTASYSLSKGSITTEAGETFEIDDDESLHFTRYFGSETFRIVLPDKENVVWKNVKLISSDLYNAADWSSLRHLTDRAQRHLDRAGNYQLRLSHYIDFTRPDSWSLKSRPLVDGEPYHLLGEDGFHAFAIGKGQSSNDLTYYLSLEEDNVAVVRFRAKKASEYHHHFGKSVVSCLEGDAQYARTDAFGRRFPGYGEFPSRYREELKTNNYVTIKYEDGSSYSGSVLCNGSGNFANTDEEFLSYLLFGLDDIKDLSYYTGIETTANGSRKYYVETGDYADWRKEADAVVAAEKARVAEEEARLEAQRQAEREREEAALRAQQEKEDAAYKAECKKYGKKYVDKARNYQLEIGMPEELFLKYFSKKRTVREGIVYGTWTLHKVYKSSRSTQYRLDLDLVSPFTDETDQEWIYVWFEKGIMTSYDSSN